MAGPSIFVRIIGDVAGLGKSFTEIQGKGQSAAQSMHSAFSGMLNQLNSTGVLGPFGAALSTADQSLQAMEGHAKKTSDKMIGIGGAAAGVGFALSSLGSKDQAAHQQLQASVQATGHSYDQYATQVEAAVKHQENFGHTADDTQNALRVLTSATHDPNEALKLLNTTTDLAAAKHEDLTTASEQVGKAYNGSARIFKEFGVTVEKNTSGTKDYHKAVGDLGTRLAGQASAQANTFNGHLKDMKAVVQDHVSLFGQKYGPAIGTAGLALAGFGSAMKGAKGVAEGTAAATNALKDSQVIQSGVTKAATAIQWLFNAAMDANPILIVVLAIIAIIAILILLATHFKAVRDVVDDVWKFLKKAWDDILGIIQGVFNWVKDNWPLLLAILTGPIGLAIYFITKYWDDFVGFFTGIPGKLAQAGKGMWDFIANAFISVLNVVINAWDALHFKTPSIDILGFHTPSVDIGLPHIDTIPHMAQGGLITQSGLIYAHAGEAITPAPAGTGGPLLAIEHAHFDEMDMDALMRRVAWLARSRGRRFSAA
jgi:fumarate reductase subunit C